ncbi:MAG: trypsin-like peptidase domain-containing protein [Betaproteobacteria bacterium]|nr:trypsin-like peptidase domain-containing protein [Betaproteobacteria bacterium]
MIVLATFWQRVLKIGMLACATFAALQTNAQPVPAPTREVSLPAPSAPARDLFAKYKDRLIQVRVLLNSASEQSSLGSGFFVRDDGDKGALLVTNYHVVSSLAIDPHKYRIEIRQTSEESAKATLVAVDVLNDLALLRMAPRAAKAAPTLQVRDTMPKQGEKLFALGNPMELGFLISEGVFNGLVESRINDHMLFSGAINSGMSGGPAIDDYGRVAGVNVSVLRDGQLLSFLVPSRFVTALIERGADAAPRKEWRSEIGKQLTAHQALITAKLFGEAPAATNRVGDAKAGFSTQKLDTRDVTTLDGSLTKCWANANDGDSPRYRADTLRCSLKSEVFVRRGLSSGSIAINHSLLRKDKLATPQFLAMGSVARQFTGYFRTHSADLTDSRCGEDYFKGKLHVYRVTTCMEAFRKFDGLYRLSMSAMQVDDVNERILTGLTLNGFSFDNAQRISRDFLERLQ